MATSGITLSGFNGIDFNSILDAVMQYERLPLQGLLDDQKKVQNKDSAFVSLSGMISALETPVTALTTGTAFTTAAAASSDPTVATVSVGEGALLGQYDVSIVQLAKAQVTKSTNGYSASSDIAATGGSISFTINGQSSEALTVTAGTSLVDLAKQITAANLGVNASVVNDGTNYKLVLTSSKTGATHVLNLTLRLRSLTAYELEPWTVLLAAKMEEDIEWGGLARDTELDEEGWLFYDPVFPQTGVDMKYKLTY